MEAALSEATKLFGSDARPNVRKVVVIIADRRSGQTLDDIKMAANQLENTGVQIIPVAFGSEAAPQELEKTTSNKKNLVDTKDDEDPKKIADKIMKKLFKSI